MLSPDTHDPNRARIRNAGQVEYESPPMPENKPVFLSYARQTSGRDALALHEALGNALCFVDVEDLETADRFPERLSEALLGAKLFVAFVDQVYFRRWYCLREWMLALAPWRSAVESGHKNPDAALAHLVVVLAGDLADEDLARLPPPAQRTNWLKGAETQTIAGHVRRRLARTRSSVRRQLETFRVAAANRDLLASDAVLPFQPRRLTMPQNLENVGQSLSTGFVGRANELWRLHDLLSTARYGGNENEAVTCALQGIGGSGKTRLAIEYARRFGPLQYVGGIFWLNASDPQGLVDQFQRILTALGEEPDPHPEEDETRQRLGHALIDRASIGPILYIVDDLPESGPGEPILPLREYCPALGHVACLVTSRVLQGYGQLVRPLALDVLDPPAARNMLSQGTNAAVTRVLGERELDELANWCGCLPLALEVLNGVLVNEAATAEALLQQARSDDIARALSLHVARLRRSMPPDVVRGAEVFEVSYRRLDRTSQAVAQYLAWLAPVPVPLRFIQVTRDVQPVVDAAVALLVARSLLKRVGDRQQAIEMHAIVASFIRTVHSRPGQEAVVFMSVVQRFAELPSAEDDVPSREHMLDLLDHLRWHTARFRRTGHDAPLDERALALLEEVLSSLQGLSNATDLDAPALAILDLCDLLEPRRTAPQHAIERGAIHTHRGKALLNLSMWDTGTVRLQQALEKTQKALEIYDRDEHPLQWAQLQDNLGLIWFRLGERAGEASEGERLFGEAETAFGAALQIYTIDEHRVDCARTQNHLGNVLLKLGELERHSDRGIQQNMSAVEAHGRALEAYRKEDEPASWAVTIMNRGLARMRVGQDTDREDYLSDAVTDLRSSLEFYTKESRPLSWAIVQYNLANAFRSLAILTTGRNRAKLLFAAEGAARSALDVFTKDKQPVNWAAAHLALARLLSQQASQRTPQRLLSQAAASFRSALEIFSESVHPQERASAEEELKSVLAALRVQRKKRRS
jgi:tetratricopeptide (TPR) repeat protein